MDDKEAKLLESAERDAAAKYVPGRSRLAKAARRGAIAIGKRTRGKVRDAARAIAGKAKPTWFERRQARQAAIAARFRAGQTTEAQLLEANIDDLPADPAITAARRELETRAIDERIDEDVRAIEARAMEAESTGPGSIESQRPGPGPLAIDALNVPPESPPLRREPIDVADPPEAIAGPASEPQAKPQELPAFYHQEFGGESLAQLLEMRDWKRSQIPQGITVKAWKEQIRSRIQNWAERESEMRQGIAPRQRARETAETIINEPSAPTTAAKLKRKRKPKAKVKPADPPAPLGTKPSASTPASFQPDSPNGQTSPPPSNAATEPPTAAPKGQSYLDSLAGADSPLLQILRGETPTENHAPAVGKPAEPSPSPAPTPPAVTPDPALPPQPQAPSQIPEASASTATAPARPFKPNALTISQLDKFDRDVALAADPSKLSIKLGQRQDWHRMMIDGMHPRLNVPLELGNEPGKPLTAEAAEAHEQAYRQAHPQQQVSWDQLSKRDQRLYTYESDAGIQGIEYTRRKLLTRGIHPDTGHAIDKSTIPEHDTSELSPRDRELLAMPDPPPRKTKDDPVVFLQITADEQDRRRRLRAGFHPDTGLRIRDSGMPTSAAPPSTPPIPSAPEKATEPQSGSGIGPQSTSQLENPAASPTLPPSMGPATVPAPASSGDQGSSRPDPQRTAPVSPPASTAAGGNAAPPREPPQAPPASPPPPPDDETPEDKAKRAKEVAAGAIDAEIVGAKPPATDPFLPNAMRMIEEMEGKAPKDAASRGEGTENKTGWSPFLPRAQQAVEQLEQEDATKPATEPTENEPSTGSKIADWTQLGLDAIGVFDPSPVVDTGNALISLFRAFVTDPKRRGHHLKNAAISGIAGWIPYLGDAAKAGKLGKFGESKAFQKGFSMTEKATANAKRQRVDEALHGTENESKEEQQQKVAAAAIAESEGETNAPAGAANTQGEPSPAGATPEKRRKRGIWSSIMGTYRAATGNDEQERAEAEKERAEHRRELTSEQDQRSKNADAFRRLLDATGALTLGLGTLTAKAVDWVNRIIDGNNALLNKLEPLGNYHGDIAMAQAIKDIRDTQRQMRRAEAISEPTARLSAAQSNLEDAMQRVSLPLETMKMEFKAGTTELGAKVTNVAIEVTQTATILRGISDALQSMSAWWRGKEEQKDGVVQSTPWQDFLRDSADGAFDGKAPYMGRNKRHKLF